ncbi:MAG: 3-methyl-2-oxobutanoate hydroxymethyltransferase [Candidatus Latescibacteria bacterium]|nr:3-methyl-2-oxobutanoate hydroxymethyltransferase [Candidatus Latescibacterota bacterium]
MVIKITIPGLVKMKKSGKKIVCLTAYDYLTAQIFDRAEIDLILVGDSAANVIYGHSTTLPIGMSEMLSHTQAVCNAVKRALVVADMPFMSYQPSVDVAIKNAGDFLKAGAQAVKLEGGTAVLEIAEKLIKFGIPVMGHLGLTPQSVHAFGGYKLQAKTNSAQKQLIQDAKQLENIGCFSIVLEKIPSSIAKTVTDSLKIPTIGIGAGPACDGQILVWQDMLGLSEIKLKFVKQYADLRKIITGGVKQYKKEVEQGTFPQKKHSFEIDECP